MKQKSIKWFMAISVWLLKISNGRLGSKLGSQSILLLETTGRKSGRQHTLPIAYFERDQRVIIVASNWGRDPHAHWYLNLKSNPRAKLGIRGAWLDAVAHEAEGEEYERLWRWVTNLHPPYLSYQSKTSRKIPIMVFAIQS